MSDGPEHNGDEGEDFVPSTPDLRGTEPDAYDPLAPIEVVELHDPGDRERTDKENLENTWWNIKGAWNGVTGSIPMIDHLLEFYEDPSSEIAIPPQAIEALKAQRAVLVEAEKATRTILEGLRSEIEGQA